MRVSDGIVKVKGVELDLRSAVWLCSSRGKSGTDGNAVEVAFLDDGYVAVRQAATPAGDVLIFDADEWEAFVLGAKDGEFNL